MEPLHIVVLALIQGITEFLPISSSAHLILPSALLGWPDQGLAFDVAVHVGTLAAVVIYFRHDLVSLVHGWLRHISGRGASEESHLAWFIALATVPAGLIGLLFNDFVATHLRSIVVLATTTVVFGVLLGWADMRSSQRLRMADMTWRLALIIGFAQAMALVPGTSRSGITITAALLLGFCRSDAARFSFLMSIPVILLSGSLQLLELTADAAVEWRSIVLGALVSGVSAYLCIHFFLNFISRLSMMPFVIYRLVLGAVLFAMLAAV